MKILITGANGYIGQYLQKHFMKEEIYKTSRTSVGDRVRKLILENEETIPGVCDGMDVVIHTATMDERQIPHDPRTAFLINSYGTRQLYLEAQASNVKKFIYLSTFHVYGKNEINEITEETETRPVSDYALTHLAAEHYLRQLYKPGGIKTAIIRPTNGIGLPGNGVDKWYLVLNDFCRTVAREGKIVLSSNGLPRRDFIPIEDICAAIGTLVSADFDFEIYNISYQKTYSIRELAIIVKNIYTKLTERQAELIMPEASAEEIANVRDFVVKSEKLRTLGWRPKKTIEEIVEKILKEELA